MKNGNRSKTVRISIIVLAILLAISATALAGTVIYRYFTRSQGSPAVSPDNVITPEKTASTSVSTVQLTTLSYRTVSAVQAAPMAVRTVSTKSTVVDQADGENVTLKIYRNHAEDSTPFQVNNMFPGDSETKNYYLEVSYKGSVTVHLHADIRSGYEKLAEVLKCRVSIDDGTLLYDGLMRDMPQSISYALPNSKGTTETFVYNITVYLDTGVGNEYMSRELYADFRWWVNEDSSEIPTDPTDPSQPTEPTDPSEPTEPSNPTEPTQPGELIPPQTGDNMHLCIWFWIAMASILLNIVLLYMKLRRKGEKQEDVE